MSFVRFLVFLVIEIFDVTNGQQSYKCIKVERFEKIAEQISNCSHCNAMLSRIDVLEKQVEVQQGKIQTISFFDILFSIQVNFMPSHKQFYVKSIRKVV